MFSGGVRRRLIITSWIDMEKDVSFNEWLTVAMFSADIKDLNLEGMSRPEKVGGKDVPESLDEMTIGQMLDLSSLSDGREMFFRVCEVLLGLKESETGKARAVEVVRFVGWVLGRVKEINGLFEKTKGNPTPQELKAGIRRLNFGVFGMIDWYAQRMGITDHEEVMSVPWMRLYKCLDMDNQTKEFNRRLAKVYENEYRRKN